MARDITDRKPQRFTYCVAALVVALIVGGVIMGGCYGDIESGDTRAREVNGEVLDFNSDESILTVSVNSFEGESTGLSFDVSSFLKRSGSVDYLVPGEKVRVVFLEHYPSKPEKDVIEATDVSPVR